MSQTGHQYPGSCDNKHTDEIGTECICYPECKPTLEMNEFQEGKIYGSFKGTNLPL